MGRCVGVCVWEGGRDLRRDVGRRECMKRDMGWCGCGCEGEGGRD